MHAPLTPPVFRSWHLRDGTTIRGRCWPARRPHPEPVLYLHGIQSHGGWFQRSASLLADDGRLVVLPDRRGSGLNEADRGDTPSAERWLKDLDEIADWTLREAPADRLALVAVSWGAKLAVAWALRHPERVMRLLLVTPGVFPAVDPGAVQRVRIGLTLLAGGRTRFEIPLNDPALFTDNPAGQAFIRDDPLKLTHATARFLFHSARLDRRLRRAAAGSLRVPVTMLLASRERIIRNGPTVAWLRRIASAPPVIHTLNGAHTLEFGAAPEPFFDFLTRWRDADYVHGASSAFPEGGDSHS